jgi:EAL domain-containing protein (putative c-di-GMP-specific phosphodiesterase class I)
VIALLETGCDFGQGYLLGCPAPAEGASFAAAIAAMRRPVRGGRQARAINALAH